jgi:hypothetical protein
MIALVENNFLSWHADTLDYDLSKAERSKDGKAVVPFAGTVSVEVPDADGDIMIQKGMDWSFALEKGIMTWEHPAHPKRLAGYPTKASLTTYKGTPATRLEGYIYKGSEYGDLVLSTLEVMKSDNARTLGLSIEGKAKKLGKQGSYRTIEKSVIRSVAFTLAPACPDSWLDIAASVFGKEAVAKSDTLDFEQAVVEYIKACHSYVWEEASNVVATVMAATRKLTNGA